MEKEREQGSREEREELEKKGKQTLEGEKAEEEEGALLAGLDGLGGLGQIRVEEALVRAGEGAGSDSGLDFGPKGLNTVLRAGVRQTEGFRQTKGDAGPEGRRYFSEEEFRKGVEEARAEGERQGRKALMAELRKLQKETDGLPHLGNGSVFPKREGRVSSIFDLARQA